MLFNSWPFVILTLTSLIVYYLPILRKYQVYVLLTACLCFYAYDNLSMLLLLIVSVIVNAVSSYGAMYGSKPRVYATVGIVVNLSILCVFKYGGQISETFFDSNEGIGHFLCSLPLPLGISFYIFSGISLVLDAFRGKFDEGQNSLRPAFLNHFRSTFLYICYFPKLLAGPIIKSKQFFSEISPKYYSHINWSIVFKSLVLGYFLKMVIADNLKDHTFWMAYPYFETRSTSLLILMLFGYSIQMFADFAGYSLIAIGVSALFGYKLPTNFNFPYISTSFREFWKRWHITLSQFLMEYLYISLGGNRKGKIRTYLNLLLTMMLGGLWHGAAWSYLVWGTFHGICLVIERAICGRRENCIQFGSNYIAEKISRYVSMLFVFVLVSFGWLLFKLSNFSEAVIYVKCIFSNYTSIGNTIYKMVLSRFIYMYMLPILLYYYIYCNKDKNWMKKYILKYDYILYGAMLFLIITNSGSASSFVYFQF